ncbi:hypothetical protein ACFU9F_20870 [Streptomyces zhihengii]|uniref:hypothetical protein n=1 Tax=Streptomyces zhihengii TaxID=1818004 RepID=UPI0036A8E90B
MSTAPQDLMALIHEHADSIRAGLGPEGFAVLHTRVLELAQARQSDTRAVRRALQGVRLTLLRLPLDHPVRQSLDGTRLAGSTLTADITLRAQELLAWIDAPRLGAEATHDIIASARRRLLAAPALERRHLGARQSEPPPRELIALADAEGERRYPAFQFDGGPAGTGGPLPVVLRINRMLLADIDPWGACDWWLSGNRELGAPPAALLGALSDDVLTGAAHALAEGEL